ncbi:nuclear mitotic apparatus protein 1, putative [Bodo saltans]|uniref:Nuclear mitotic apparatus protein 1, putative n=1 Tax=Bodo saltans TaxID=75058 RepID=A0A0S4J265_BODSA|nr:nuclear mitotic apparatus protein 1, putative [Bodo saltans]|eukprot:CUG65261.1 nuclear mitotic apparatus protein 1, putative [Bodo saltans]
MSDPASVLAWGRSIVAAKRGVVGVTAGAPGTSSSTSQPNSPPPSSQYQHGTTGNNNVVQGSQQFIAQRLGSNSAIMQQTQPMQQQQHNTRNNNNNNSLDGAYTKRRVTTPGGSSSIIVPASSSAASNSAIRAFTAAAAPASEHVYHDGSRGSEPMEATEPHWHWLNRMDGSTTSSTNAGQQSTAADRSVGNNNNPLSANQQQQQQRLSTMVKRRGSVGDASKPSAAASPSSSSQDPSHVVMILQHDEEILRRRVESEKKHVAELETMRDRNQTEFKQRESELITEIEHLPKALEEAESRRAARLSKSTTVVQEQDLQHLEEILWNLETRVHTLSEEEEQYGKEVHALAACIETTGVLAVESRDLLLESMFPALAAKPPLLEALRRSSFLTLEHHHHHHHHHPHQEPSTVAFATTSELPGVRTDLLLSTEALHEAFALLPSSATTVSSSLTHSGGTVPSSSSQQASLMPPEKIFEIARHVIGSSVTPFLHDIEHVTAALRTRREELLDARKRSAADSEAQLADQKLTMDDAHTALSELAVERDQLEETSRSVANRISELQLLLESAAKTHDAEIQRANSLLQRRSSLEEEVRELKETIATAKRECSELQLAERRHKMVHDSNVARCDELRDQSRVASRSQADATETQFTKIQKNMRTTSTHLEQHQRDIQRLTAAITTSKHQLMQANEKQHVTQQRLEAHSMETYQCEREHFELQKEAEELDRAHQGALQAIEALRRDTAVCREEVYQGRQELREVQDSVLTLTDCVQDADEELELVRAVLLFQEEGAQGGGVVGNAEKSKTATIAAKIAHEDRSLLWGGGTAASPVRPLVRQQHQQYRGVGKSFREEFEADDGEMEAAVHVGEGHVGRYESNPVSPTTGGTTTTIIYPPDNLETVDPPSAWQQQQRQRAPPPTPITVTPHPRHFHRELQSLQTSREEGRRALMEFLQDEERLRTADNRLNDNDGHNNRRLRHRNETQPHHIRKDIDEAAVDTFGETGSSVGGGDRSSSTRSLTTDQHRSGWHQHQHRQQPQGLHGASQWQHAPSVMLARVQQASDDDDTTAQYKNLTSSGHYDRRSTSTRSSSVYSSPPASEPDIPARRHHQQQQQHRQHHPVSSAQRLQQQQQQHPASVQQQTHAALRESKPSTIYQDATQQQLPPFMQHANNVRPITMATTTEDTNSNAPSDTQVKSKLQRVVSDHSAPPRKPFR